MDVRALSERAASLGERFLAELGAMVNVDCGSFTPAGVNQIADRCQARLGELGFQVDRRSHEPAPGEPQLGDLLVGTLTGRGGPSFLLIGHTDTVFDEGTASDRPLSIHDGRATGPGVSDMKAGLIAGFDAVQVLLEEGFDAFDRITYVCNPDEEIGSPFSGPVIASLAPAHDAAFVMESARANGDIVSARKGTSDLVVRFRGRAAHAGVEPEKGSSAVLAAARTTVALHDLNGRWPGVTVNVGVARGGTRSNVVAERSELHIDLRSPDPIALTEARAQIDLITHDHRVDGVEVEIDDLGSHPPMERGAGAAELVRTAAQIASELGFSVRDTATGGASDANTTSAAGTPTLDGLGPVGGAAHSVDEWLDLTSVPDRVALLAGLIARTPARPRRR